MDAPRPFPREARSQGSAASRTRAQRKVYVAWRAFRDRRPDAERAQIVATDVVQLLSQWSRSHLAGTSGDDFQHAAGNGLATPATAVLNVIRACATADGWRVSMKGSGASNHPMTSGPATAAGPVATAWEQAAPKGGIAPVSRGRPERAQRARIHPRWCLCPPTGRMAMRVVALKRTRRPVRSSGDRRYLRSDSGGSVLQQRGRRIATASSCVFLAGFCALLIFWWAGTSPGDSPGLFDFRAATLGDALLLPTLTGVLVAVMADDRLLSPRRERKDRCFGRTGRERDAERRPRF